MGFQRGDRIILWGMIVEVQRTYRRQVEVRHVNLRAPQGPFWVSLVWAQRHQKGFWRGELIPEHRRVESLIEPYVWSHEGI